MSVQGPPPIVPSMQTADEPETTEDIRADGGSETTSGEREKHTFGAPLVPDCS